MSEIPMFPNECAHREEPERCWQCLTTEAVVLRDALRVAKEHADGLGKLATHLQSELDRERGRAATADHKLTQIRAILENYQDNEHFSAWSAVGAIEELKP